MATDITLNEKHALNDEDAQYLSSLIRTIPGFPNEGILFRDFMPVFATPHGSKLLTDALISILPVDVDSFDYVVGLEARGFLIGMALAQRLNKGFVAVRKAGKLPPPVVSQSYTLEYGKASVEIEEDLIKPGSRVLIVDDLVATGGTAWAAKQLMEKVKAEVVGFAFVMKLDGLDGYERISQYPISSLFTMPA